MLRWRPLALASRAAACAVVAGEVRNLAQRSAGAAKEIKTLIGNSVEKVESGFRLVESAGKTMDDIVASVKRVTDIMGEITAASQEAVRWHRAGQPGHHLDGPDDPAERCAGGRSGCCPPNPCATRPNRSPPRSAPSGWRTTPGPWSAAAPTRATNVSRLPAAAMPQARKPAAGPKPKAAAPAAAAPRRARAGSASAAVAVKPDESLEEGWQRF